MEVEYVRFVAVLGLALPSIAFILLGGLLAASVYVADRPSLAEQSEAYAILVFALTVLVLLVGVWLLWAVNNHLPTVVYPCADPKILGCPKR